MGGSLRRRKYKGVYPGRPPLFDRGKFTLIDLRNLGVTRLQSMDNYPDVSKWLEWRKMACTTVLSRRQINKKKGTPDRRGGLLIFEAYIWCLVEVSTPNASHRHARYRFPLRVIIGLMNRPNTQRQYRVDNLV